MLGPNVAVFGGAKHFIEVYIDKRNTNCFGGQNGMERQTNADHVPLCSRAPS